MSTYGVSQTTINPVVVDAYDLAEGECDALLHGMSSAKAAALAHDIAGIPRHGISGASAWAQVDAAMPGWQEHLPKTSLDAMAAARCGDIPLPAALSAVTGDLGAIERLAVTSISMKVLGEMGAPSPMRVDGSRTSAIEAAIGHATMLIRIADQGAIETEYIGLADGSCNDLQQEFAARMRSHGVLFDEQVNVQHHDPRGGALAQDAARVGGPSRAAALVADGDSKPSTFTTSLFAPTSSARQRAAEGGR
ncbi:hypothetical protein SA2016_0844 [Sinomonas atrocyanea]|uniref:Uncharacterized protein n=1 Tax=Sinomonas atrocyanea TaxID=37927 RepID=A0A127A1K9_9MICC|nr:hypothetical protein [Sinomonas atrocyanea]AMM31532.1 hypothetical protein SA2016_0844 [Sinomonas atrocyanea]GEB66037.1 hypothetical protein SAT01_34850 [Sinomonas atrocyanea]GGG63417.1 hypothetical protein GCM10007172_13350 [Sinomonas atrocyanea]